MATPALVEASALSIRRTPPVPKKPAAPVEGVLVPADIREFDADLVVALAGLLLTVAIWWPVSVLFHSFIGIFKGVWNGFVHGNVQWWRSFVNRLREVTGPLSRRKARPSTPTPKKG